MGLVSQSVGHRLVQCLKCLCCFDRLQQHCTKCKISSHQLLGLDSVASDQFSQSGKQHTSVNKSDGNHGHPGSQVPQVMPTVDLALSTSACLLLACHVSLEPGILPTTRESSDLDLMDSLSIDAVLKANVPLLEQYRTEDFSHAERIVSRLLFHSTTLNSRERQ